MPSASGHEEPLCHLAQVQGASRCCRHCRPGLQEWAGSAACVPGEGAEPGPVFPDGAALTWCRASSEDGDESRLRRGPAYSAPHAGIWAPGHGWPSPPPPLPWPPSQDCQVRWCRLCPVGTPGTLRLPSCVSVQRALQPQPLLMCAGHWSRRSGALEVHTWAVPGQGHLAGGQLLPRDRASASWGQACEGGRKCWPL